MKIFLASLLSLLAFAAYAQTAPETVAPAKPFELSYADAEDAIGWVLMQKGVGDKVAATITSHKTGPLFSFNKPVSVDIRGIQYDKQSSHWTASLLFVSDGEVVSALPASGHFEEMVELPVLKRQLHSGDVIAANDLEVRDYPVDHTRTDTISDMASLIGKSPVRAISPYHPVRASEISTPAIVKKNALVEMHYNSPGMQISTSGQAMTDGAKGEVIGVRNLTSKKIIQAVIDDSGSVSVLPASAQQASSDVKGTVYAAN